MTPAGASRTPWRTALEGHGSLLRLFERELQRDARISLSWYDVLLHLSEAPRGMLRMNALADDLVLSRSWLTRRVTAMESAGLVRRCPAPDDARGVCAALTSEGRRVFRRAARAHLRSVEQHFMRHLSSDEAETIEACFDRVGAAARDALRSGDV